VRVRFEHLVTNRINAKTSWTVVHEGKEMSLEEAHFAGLVQRVPRHGGVASWHVEEYEILNPSIKFRKYWVDPDTGRWRRKTYSLSDLNPAEGARIVEEGEAPEGAFLSIFPLIGGKTRKLTPPSPDKIKIAQERVRKAAMRLKKQK
jgi:hypothetical protein